MQAVRVVHHTRESERGRAAAGERPERHLTVPTTARAWRERSTAERVDVDRPTLVVAPYRAFRCSSRNSLTSCWTPWSMSSRMMRTVLMG